MDQAKLNTLLRKIFGIETDFVGTIMSNLAKLNFKSICNDANEAHAPVWLGVLEEQKIFNTPLSTLISHELLYNHPLSVDGSAITKTGFSYTVPQCGEKEVREEIDFAEKQKIFPSGITK